MLKLTNQEYHIGYFISRFIEMEHVIDEYIKQNLLHPEYYKDLRFSFEKKILLLLAFGFPKKLLPALKVLNKTRNNLAHLRNKELDDKEVNKIYSSMIIDSQNRINNNIEKLKKDLPEDLFNKSDLKWLLKMAFIFAHLTGNIEGLASVNKVINKKNTKLSLLDM